MTGQAASVDGAAILVVEDERIVARHIAEILVRAGYRVPAAVATGEAALARAVELRPDLVLMDVRLAGQIDGIEAAGLIRERTGIPVVYLTAFADGEILDRAKRTEPAGFVVKPFADRDLQATLAMALYRVESERQREAKALSAELAEQHTRLRRIYAATVDAREQEARRIGRELHDQAGQLLSALHLALEDVGSELRPSARGRIRALRSMVDEVEQQLRRIAHEMRPPILDDLGLVPAIDLLARGVSQRTGLRVTVEGPRVRVPPEIETNLYRIAQEALTNVVRHARARQAWIEVHLAGGEAGIAVRDDGSGFVVDAVLGEGGERGLGFLAIKERVAALRGRLQVESAPGQGTLVRVTMPLVVTPCVS